jgi:phosphoribosylamine--glycine ligase
VKALLLGSGGRESALAWALDRSSLISEVIAAPGNAGIESFATCVEVETTAPSEVVDLARRTDPGLVVIGPEAPLVAGVADALRSDGRRVFGPDAAAARIEGSKAYAKALMDQAGVSTARWQVFDEIGPATAFLEELGPPYVVKADGLAAGKGVVVTTDRDEAVAAIEDRLLAGKFGEAGRRVVIEEYLDGDEASLIAFTDGKTVVACEPAQDYKRVLDDDQGPNTGGMGSYSPVPACPSDRAHAITEEILEPMVRATAAAGAPFVGALYAGLVLSSKGPRVLEFNARFGDPETQALLPRLRSDLGEVCLACAERELEGTKLDWSPQVCVSVVLASAGYPGEHKTDLPIKGVEEAEAIEGITVFHAGTARANHDLVTAGGRVLAVSALGGGFRAARARAYDAVARIDFEGKHARSDIALRAETTERDE